MTVGQLKSWLDLQAEDAEVWIPLRGGTSEVISLCAMELIEPQRNVMGWQPIRLEGYALQNKRLIQIPQRGLIVLS